jgi:capsular exopolysaccharide synthesis family protein
MATVSPDATYKTVDDPVTSTVLLPVGDGTSSTLANFDEREWVFPGADDVFRGIYMRSCNSDREMLAVCSAIPGEGKTTVAIGLGIAMAQDFPDRRVLVVETDLRNPVLAKDFDIDPSPGLAECLQENLPAQMAYRATFLDNLTLVPGGAPTLHSARLLRSARMATALDAMCESHDLVILDVPAVLAGSDAMLLTDVADGVVFVVRTGVTPMPLINKALDQIEEKKLRGVVLNGSDSAVPGWLRRLCGF